MLNQFVIELRKYREGTLNGEDLLAFKTFDTEEEAGPVFDWLKARHEEKDEDRKWDTPYFMELKDYGQGDMDEGLIIDFFVVKADSAEAIREVLKRMNVEEWKQCTECAGCKCGTK